MAGCTLLLGHNWFYMIVSTGGKRQVYTLNTFSVLRLILPVDKGRLGVALLCHVGKLLLEVHVCSDVLENRVFTLKKRLDESVKVRVLLGERVRSADLVEVGLVD